MSEIGSDFQHPEGLAKLLEFAQRIARVGENQRGRIMRENAAELLGLA